MNRNLQIDVLRAVAILMVLVAHTALFRPPDTWETVLTRGTWAGVDLFFVLSGYLISGLLFSEYQKRGRINFGRFAARRAMKIYPPFYLLITGVLVGKLLTHNAANTSAAVVPFLHDVFFVQSYLPGTYGHFWSLAVEEHFYILLPLSLYFGIRLKRGKSGLPFNWIPSAFVIFAISTLVARAATWYFVHPFDYSVHFFPTHLRMDSLMFGVFLSYLAHFQPQRIHGFVDRHYWAILAGSIVLIAPELVMEQLNPLTYTIGFTFLYLGFGGILMVALRGTMPKGALLFALSRLAAIGKHSYSIYLWHILILSRLRGLGLTEGPYGLALYFMATLGIGIGISLLVDIPVLRLRDRIWPRMAPVEPVPSDAARAASASL